jgi:hypothetical protein
VNQGQSEDKWRLQRDPWYAALGCFVVQFEHMCHEMKLCILQAEGNFSPIQTQNLASAELDGLVAGRLLHRFKEAATKLRSDYSEEMQILNNISERLRDLIEKRNDVIHRTWFVEYGIPGGEDEFSKAPSLKFKMTKSGPESKPLELEAGDFDDLQKEAKELSDIVFRIYGCLAIGRLFSKNFKVENGIVRLPQKT